jgi:hypothetical protein
MLRKGPPTHKAVPQPGGDGGGAVPSPKGRPVGTP